MVQHYFIWVSNYPCMHAYKYFPFQHTLSCVFCRVKLIYPRDVRVEHREQAARLFSEQMVTRHASHCPWRKTKCQPSLLKHQWAEKAAADDGGELSRYNARVLRLMVG